MYRSTPYPDVQSSNNREACFVEPENTAFKLESWKVGSKRQGIQLGQSARGRPKKALEIDEKIVSPTPTAVPHNRHPGMFLAGLNSIGLNLNSLWLARRAEYMDVFCNPVT